jgi:hypothetical protein
VSTWRNVRTVDKLVLGERGSRIETREGGIRSRRKLPVVGGAAAQPWHYDARAVGINLDTY